MTHQRSFARITIAWLLALGSLGSLAAAAPLTSFAGRRAGTGSLQGAPGTAELSEAEVRLRAGGAVEIVVRDRRGSFQFIGTWHKDPGDYIKLKIGEALGAPADASGWVLVRGDRFEQIELDGRSEGGRKLALSFKASGPDLPIAADWPGLDSTQGGYGVLERSRVHLGIERARVELQPDGAATVTLWSPGPQRISGTWSDRRDDSVKIEIREAFGDSRATGSGTVRFRRGDLEQLELTGDLSRGSFGAQFRAGAEAPRPTGRPGAFSAEYGYDQPGGDYRNLPAGDLDQCQEACAGEGRCRAYTFNTRDHRCFLKDSERPMVRRSDAVTGVKRGGTGPSAGLSERQGYSLEGGDYSRVYLDSLGQCQDACRSDRQCLAYTYNLSDRMCYLKDRVPAYTPRRDTVSGEKESRR